MRNVLEVDVFETLFLMFTEALKAMQAQKQSYRLLYKEQDPFLYVILMIEDASIIETIQQKIEVLKIPFLDLANLCLVVFDQPCLGYIYRCNDPYKKNVFQQIIQETVAEYTCNKE